MRLPVVQLTFEGLSSWIFLAGRIYYHDGLDIRSYSRSLWSVPNGCLAHYDFMDSQEQEGFVVGS